MRPLLEDALAELKAQRSRMPSISSLSPLTQVVLLAEATVWLASKGDEATRVLAARELVAAVRRLDPDVRLGLDA
jgi:hypothetical protein